LKTSVSDKQDFDVIQFYIKIFFTSMNLMVSCIYFLKWGRYLFKQLSGFRKNCNGRIKSPSTCTELYQRGISLHVLSVHTSDIFNEKNVTNKGRT
jgi:hypothetical protein